MRVLLLTLLLVCNLALANPGSSLREIITVVEQKKPVASIKKTLTKFLYVNSIAAEIAGRAAWRAAESAERKQFTTLLSDHLLSYYAETIKNLARYKYSFISRPNSKRQVLRVNNPNGSSTDLVVFFQKINGSWLIVDSSFNGISIVAQWRAKLNARIKSRGLNGIWHD